MMLDKYKKEIPYFLVERKILFELKKKYSLILTTAGKNAPVEMRKKLGYENISSWNDDDSISGVLLRGAGEKAFCAGGDIVSVYHSKNEDGNNLSYDFFKGLIESKL